MQENSMEMIWRASTSMIELEVFAGAFISGNYGPPEGFCFDSKCTSDDPVRLTIYNIYIFEIYNLIINHPYTYIHINRL